MVGTGLQRSEVANLEIRHFQQLEGRWVIVDLVGKSNRVRTVPIHIRLHDLRHTFVSFMLSQNVPPKDVQVIAGHASFKTTMDISSHLIPGAQQEAAEKMDKLFDV